jgi:hypothetical protein
MNNAPYVVQLKRKIKEDDLKYAQFLPEDYLPSTFLSGDYLP